MKNGQKDEEKLISMNAKIGKKRTISNSNTIENVLCVKNH